MNTFRNLITKDHTHDSHNIYIYLDGLGRNIQAKTGAANGKWTTVDFYYDETGRNYKNSVPYETYTSAYTDRDENQAYVENEYDAIGRVKQTTHTDGNIGRAFYDHTKYMFMDTANHVSLSEIMGNTIVATIYENTYPGIDPINNPSTPLYTIPAVYKMTIKKHCFLPENWLQ